MRLRVSLAFALTLAVVVTLAVASETPAHEEDKHVSVENDLETDELYVEPVDYEYAVESAEDEEESLSATNNNAAAAASSVVSVDAEEGESDDEENGGDEVDVMAAEVKEGEEQNLKFAASLDHVSINDGECPHGSRLVKGKCALIKKKKHHHHSHHPDKKKCGSRFVKDDNDRCVPLEPCQIGFYRNDFDDCVRFPSTPTCHTEVVTLEKHNRAEEVVRKNEVAVIKTIRHLISRMHNHDQEALEEDSKATTEELMQLLHSTSESERVDALNHGKKGVMSLLREVEEKIREDNRIAKQEERRLKAHCKHMCSRVVGASNVAKDSWKSKGVKLAEKIESLRKEIEDLQGKTTMMRADRKKEEAAHLRMHHTRKAQADMIAWVERKLAQLPKEEGKKLTDLDMAPIVAGLDEKDESMSELVSMMRAKDGVESSAIKKILDRELEKLGKENDNESSRIKKMHDQIQSWEDRLAGLSVKKWAHDAMAVKISGKVAQADGETVRQKGYCAAFGVMVQ